MVHDPRRTSRLAALRGRRDEAIRELDRVDTRLIDFAQDRNTLRLDRVLAASLGRGHRWQLAEHGQAASSSGRATTSSPSNAGGCADRGSTTLAEAHRGLGDNNAAPRLAIAKGGRDRP